MFQRMLVPLDGSERGERAIAVAARLARASSGSIVFVRVVLPPVEFGKYAKQRSSVWEREAFETHRAQAASYLAAIMIAHANELTGIDIELEVASGITTPSIFSSVRFEHVDLIVICGHEEMGLKGWVFGSVTQEAVRHSPVPVLVLPESGVVFPASSAAYPLRVLVALDGSRLFETALEPAAQLIAALAPHAQGALHLLRVVDPPSAEGKRKSQAHIAAAMREHGRQEAETYLKAVANRLYKGPLVAFKLTVTWFIAVSRDVAGTIIRMAHQIEEYENMGSYDLIVLTTHGRGGLRHLVLSSVSERVLGSTKLPVLIVPSHEIGS